MAKDSQVDWLDIIKVIAPLVLALIPELSKTFHPAITAAVVQAEKDGGTSAEKLTSVLAQPELQGHEQSAVTKGVEAVIAVANALQDANGTTKKGA